MAGLYRRCQPYQALYSLLSSPFILGIVIGILFNLALRNTNVSEVTQANLGSQGDKIILEDVLAVSSNKGQAKDESQKKEDKNFVRPRFVKEELNITRRLLVVIIPESDWTENDQNIKKYINSTLQPYSNDIAYIEKPKSGRTDILDIIKQLGTSHLSNYGLYYLIPDTALVIARNLKKLTDPIITSDLTYSGLKSGAGQDICQLDSGILISQILVKSMVEEMDWCYRNKIGYDQSSNLQNCVLHSSKAKCQDTFDNFPYSAIKYSSQLSSFENVISVYDLKSEENMKTLLHSLNVNEAKLINEDITKLEEELSVLINTSKYHLSPIWPLGSIKRCKSTDRYDMNIHHHFNHTHEYFKDDYESATRLNDEDVEDIDKILNLCNVQTEDFSSGWAKVDATRGKDLILEVSHKANERKLSSRKCQVVKELANPVIVQMPFVTESFKISLIIPVQEKDSQKTMTLLRSFAKNSIEKNDRIFLMLVFLYSPERPDKNNNNDFFKDVKQLALQISKKYKKDQTKSSSHLLWYSMQTKGVKPSDLELMDLVTQKLDNKTIILLGSPDMEIKSDYFNRVRMNTIQSKQVFCPIPFTEFHPAIIYGDKRPPLSMVFNTTAGHFDQLNNGHVSFYKTDYLKARSGLTKELIKHESELEEERRERDMLSDNLCLVLEQARSLHTLRAPDPSLMLRYEEVNCDNISDLVKLELCQVRRRRSLGRRRNLAQEFLGGDKRIRN